MSRGGEIVRLWGDADRTFRLGIGEWRKVQETCDAGPGEIAGRLATWAAIRQRHPKASFLDLLVAGGVGNWRVDDIREPIYRALIGGGMDPTSAGRLMRDLHDERPIMENLDLALAVVLASLVGAEDEPVGEPSGERPTTTTETPSPEENSALPPTMEPARS
jgi:hypothetical protein